MKNWTRQELAAALREHRRDHTPSLRTYATTTALRSVDAPAGMLGPRQIKATCSAPGVDRMGDVVVQSGIDTGPFQKSPTVFWAHDPLSPIARAIWTGLEDGCLTSIAQFPPEGTDETADRVYRMIKSDIPLDVSIGFIPVQYEPINPKEPWGGLRFLRCELLEWSVVGIGAQRDSRIIGKGLRGRRRSDNTDDAEDTDDGTATFGNCGMPIGSECGMKDPARCSIHGFGSVGVGTGDGDERAARLRYARTLQRKLAATIVRSDAPAALLRHAAAIRVRHGLPKRHDPRIVAAAAQFRLRNY